MRYTTTLLRFGPNNTGIEVPEEVVTAIGRGRRVKVVATVNGYAYRTSMAPYRGRMLIPFSSAQRAATGLAGGEEIEVEIVPDDAPREVVIPEDLAAALEGAPAAAAFFGTLSFTNQRLFVEWIEEARKPATREARVERAVAMLVAGETR